MENIEHVIELEKLHRYCFDKIHIQGHQNTTEDNKLIKKYNQLYAKYPTFRQVCYDEFYILNAIEKIDVKRLTKQEKINLEKLKKINFNRYSITKK